MLQFNKIQLRLFKNVLKVNRFDLKFYNANQRAVNEILNLPNEAKISIGGYLNQQVPHSLIEILAQSKCHGIHLITNASILNNHQLKSLFQINGKIKSLVTSLESNKSILQSDLKPNFELNLLSSKSFLNNYNILNSTENQADFALVKSPFIDDFSNLVWPKNISTYFNDSIALSAKYGTIAEIDQIINDENPDDYQVKVDGLFVAHVYFNTQNQEQETNFTINFDHSIDKITKRVLLEFNNNQIIFLPKNIQELVTKFYMPKHMKLVFSNFYLQNCWPSNSKWLNYGKKVDVCIVNATRVNKYGDIEINLETLEDCLINDLVDNCKDEMRVIAVMKLDTVNKVVEKFDNESQNLKTLNKKADLIITDKGVLKFNKTYNRLEVIEFESSDYLTHFGNHVNNSAHSMIQQCF